MKKSLHGWVFLAGLLLAFGSAAGQPAEENYAEFCASCHGSKRTGAKGTALLPENLERLSRPDAFRVISEGRNASQMPGFGGEIASGDIQALVDFIYEPPAETPVWGMDEIEISRMQRITSFPDKPVFDADPLNLFVAVELGDHHATLLDGEKFEPIHRFKTQFALHGAPQFSPDGRYAYFISRQGWVTKFDIYNLKMMSEIRVGLSTSSLAISDDGRTLLAGNKLPHSLVLLDAESLLPIKVIPAIGQNGKSSRVSAVRHAAARGSFVAALKDAQEVWEISGNNEVRRIAVDGNLDSFFFDPACRHLIGTTRNGAKGLVIGLDSGKKVAELDMPGMPHPAATWEYQGKPVMAVPRQKEPLVDVIDMTTWKTIRQIKLPGGSFFMRGHENSPYIWTDSFSSKDSRDTIHVIDKRSLKLVKTLRPAPGKTAAHAEFTRDGKYVLISIWDGDGALLVYDAATLKETKRLPMNKPSGKYNIHNQLMRQASGRR
jgi:hypothetical protein